MANPDTATISETIQRRVDELYTLAGKVNPQADDAGSELFSGTINLFQLVYGSGSSQVSSLISLFEKTRENVISNRAGSDRILGYTYDHLAPVIKGQLRSLRTELNAGLLGDLQRRFTGEVLGDFLALGRAALSNGGDGAKNVAAVLVAASFEDTLRRMGEELARMSGRPDLQIVVSTLKQKGILQGPSIAIANSHLKFRNDALHGDWSKIDQATISSVLSFVEGLLLKHFS